jgi:hypothetical protein
MQFHAFKGCTLKMLNSQANPPEQMPTNEVVYAGPSAVKDQPCVVT